VVVEGLDIEERADARSAAAPQVRRTPFYLESKGQPLFAWLHGAEAAPTSGHGVVICPPLGCEQVHSHRSLRHLADALARAGLTVLRFDYHGTGDSAGADEDGDRLATWLANIRDALAWLRQRLGGAVSLFGLRLGASLALEVACDEPVDSLILWAPVPGRAFVREMKALTMTGAAGRPQSASPEDIETAGFTFTRQTADALSGLDLLKCRPRCRRILLASPEGAPASTRLLDHLSSNGCLTTQIALTGYAELFVEPHHTVVPRQAIDQTVDWLLADAVPAQPGAAVSPSALSLPAEAVLQPSGARERPVSIGPQQLFGIVTQPAAGAAPDLPMVVLLNAGSVYRIGPGRLHVHLARRVAALGFPCLRLDLEGLGDSVTASTLRENDPYPETTFRDVAATLRHVQSQFGVKRVILMGLCSGAYAALHSAVSFRDPALVESILINLQNFYWQDGMSLDDPPEVPVATFHYYMSAAMQPGKWLRLLTGRSKIGIAGALRLLVQRWRMGRERRTEAPVAQTEHDLPGHPPPGDLSLALDRAAGAGRHLTFVYSREDPGWSILTFHARRKVRVLRRAGKMDVLFIDGADHTFSTRGSREGLLGVIADHLCRRYPRQRG
jgi:pimeloyl-ACP methyl ester carboxylesterase